MEKGKEHKIVVVGSSNTDMVISADRFPLPGETIMGHDFMTNQGGKGANQAVAAARLGGNVVFVGKLGSDAFGTATMQHLKDEGVDITFLRQTSKSPSGVALITTVPDGENSIIVNSGSNALLSPEDIRSSEDAFVGASILLMQLETPVDTLVEAARLAKKHNCYVILNPAPAPKTPLPKELLENVDLLIPNETEASSISGMPTGNADDVDKVMDAIERKGVKNVIITVGSHGVVVRNDGKIVTVPAFKVKAVDTTAAGDTFCGALSVAICEGKPLNEAILFANKASSISVMRKGAQMSMPKRNEID